MADRSNLSRKMTTARRLAAILAADVVGYSRLMGTDEEGTLTRLKMLRAELIDPAIAEHHGRIFKTTGDGLLVEFSSVVEAVRCAVDWQAAMAQQAETEIQFRIGIHVGDVIVEAEDIFGDGVNVAARLEGLAEPGGICISARVHEDTAGRIDAEFEDGGEQRLKNIDRPLKVYRLRTRTAQIASEPNLRHIGFVGVTRRAWYDELRRALAVYGYLEGQTIRIHYRWSEGDASRFPDMVKELLNLPVELIVATGSPPVAAAKQMTRTVPIVFVEVGDPVGYGFVPSLMRPDGNMTGLSNNLYEYAPRSLRLFKDMVPGATRVGILCPAYLAGAGEWIKSMEAVSQALEMVPRVYHANTADELRRVFPGIDARTDVLAVAPGHDYLVHRAIIISTAMALKIPVICQQPEFVMEGALLSLDPNRVELYRRLAHYVNAVLQGARPSDLPIEEPTKSWLMINLRTAKSLGIEIPGPILMRADQIIE
jgi:class 3 adenylate cyclase/ABC-type uncharacterized transport system substrate-binding protein